MVPVIPMILDLASVSTYPRTIVTNLVLILIIVIALPTKISNLVSVSPHPRPIRPNGKSLEPHKAVSSSGEALSISLFCNHCIFVVLTSFLPLKVTQGNTFIRYIGLFPFLIWQHSKKSLHQLQSLSRCFVALPVNYH